MKKSPIAGESTYKNWRIGQFKVVEFDHFRMSAGLPSFVLCASEWIERTNAVGIIVKEGRYGGPYTHKDIAFEFGSAISVPFKLHLLEEFQRLKTEEQKLLGRSAKRELSKINYHIHTDAIKTLSQLRHSLGALLRESFRRRPPCLAAPQMEGVPSRSNHDNTGPTTRKVRPATFRKDEQIP